MLFPLFCIFNLFNIQLKCVATYKIKQTNFCRKVCMISIDDKYRNRGKTDGPGHVVEIYHVEITNTQITADLRNE